MKRKVLPPGLVEFQQVKQIRPPGRYDAGKQFLTNLIYMVPLANTLKMIVPFFWNPGKTIIDVTAGKRLIWRHFAYNHISPCGFEHWHIDFNDTDPECKTDFHIPAQEIDSLERHWDILVCDFPFTDLKNGVESFGVRSKKISGRSQGDIARTMSRSRKFYFRNFVPLNELFPQCVKSFNKVADNLIIKIGDSHKDKRLISNVWEAERWFDHVKNPESKFQLVDRIGYRGNYARRGGRFPFAQSVMSYYLIFKKDVDSR